MPLKTVGRARVELSPVKSGTTGSLSLLQRFVHRTDDSTIIYNVYMSNESINVNFSINMCEIVHGISSIMYCHNLRLCSCFSAEMLANLHVPWVILGHSERRTLCGESDAVSLGWVG